jgi:hypothetical protein
MTATVKFRRSSTPGSAPTAAQLQLGEFALNTYDGALYFKKNVSGTETVLGLRLAGSLVTSDVGGGAGTLTLEHKGSQTLRIENPVEFFTGFQVDTTYTPSAGDQLQLLATAANTVLTLPAGGTLATDGPAFAAYQSAAQSFPNGVSTKVTLNAEEFDTASAFDSTTNSRFQPTVPGYYQFSGGFAISTTATAVIAFLYKNGGEVRRGTQINANASNSHVSGLLYMNGSTDYVELFGYQAGGVQNTAPGANQIYLSGFLARAQ